MPDASQSERLQPNTIATQVYRRLREDIVTGVLPPGMHLVRRTLAKRYGVSVLPVMEACFRLENDGLVENSPLLGAHVINITAEITEEERVFREAIECQAARELVAAAPEAAKNKLRELAETLDMIQESLGGGDKEVERAFQRRHSEFHLFIARQARAKLLYRQMRRLWFRRLMLSCNINTSLFPHPKGWHARLADELCSGDQDRAEREMRAHVRFNRDKNAEAVRELLRRGRDGLIGGMLEQEALAAD
jgi:DNA-binding GntR family transcriptional regulator